MTLDLCQPDYHEGTTKGQKVFKEQSHYIGIGSKLEV